MRVTVVQVRFDGLVLAVNDPAALIQEAWMPSQEWSAEEFDWEVVNLSLSKGDELEVVSLGGEHESKMLVSRKNVLPTDVISSNTIGSEHNVRVEELSKRLIRGITDYSCPVLVPQDLYQDYIDFIDSKKLTHDLRDHAVLGRGDTIRGINVGTSEKYFDEPLSIVVDLKAYLESQKTEISEAITKSVPALKADPEENPLADKRMPPEVVAQISPVLLIDDIDDCRESIAGLLSREGAEVYTIKDRQEAQEFLNSFSDDAPQDALSRRLKLAIVDPNLETESTDLFGLRIAEKLSLETDCRIILMTAEVEHSNKLKRWPNLRIHGYIAKPFVRYQLIDEIQEACNLKEPITLTELLGIDEKDQSLTDNSPTISPDPGEVSVREALQRLGRLRTGTVLHVFSLHPRSFRARSEAEWGGGINWEPLRGKIAKSVIKDVAIDRLRLQEPNVSQYKPRHLWTLRMWKYQSFLGEPVYVRGKRVALVAFHPDRGAFDEEFRTTARLTAEQVGRALEREALYETRKNEAEFVSFGMALASLAHELASEMTVTDAILSELGELASKNLNETPVQEGTRKKIALLRKNVGSISTKTRILRGAQARSEPVSIRDCLKQATTACRTVIGDLTKRILIKNVDDLGEQYFTVIPAASLIIVFFNLLLNAAQQIELASDIRSQGHISQSICEYVDEKGRSWARVRITDSGPGIHLEDWERVFEPGYTTKPEGSGLGLYICRHLLKDYSASIKITSSAIWSGTTVTVSLPLAAAPTVR